MDWPTTIAAELNVAAWDQVEHDELLDLVREIAHGTERRYGPLTAYLIGVAVGATHDASTPADERQATMRQLVARAMATLESSAQG